MIHSQIFGKTVFDTYFHNYISSRPLRQVVSYRGKEDHEIFKLVKGMNIFEKMNAMSSEEALIEEIEENTRAPERIIMTNFDWTRFSAGLNYHSEGPKKLLWDLRFGFTGMMDLKRVSDETRLAIDQLEPKFDPKRISLSMKS